MKMTMTGVPAHTKGASSYMSLRKTTSKTTQDLTEFLNFYNQHSYMNVARSIGHKVSKTSKQGSKQQTGFDTFTSIRESVS